MRDIYYIVMEILKTLLSTLLGDGKNDNLASVIKLFSDNSFDIKKVLQNLDLSAILPILLKFLSKNTPAPAKSYSVQGYGLNPITNLADKEIVYTLGRYFHEPI